MFNKIKAFFSAVPVANRIKGNGPDIAIVNHCSQVSADEVTKTVAAIQVQIDRDFEPVWNLPANLLVYQPNDVLPVDSWVMHILDTSDQAGALGYHELTPAGNPIGYVFAADDIKYGLSWSVTLSHELLEMLGDPYINTSIFVQTSNTEGTLYAYENCDAVEDDQFAYTINGVLVSDWVFPAWFQEFRKPNSTQFSFKNQCSLRHSNWQLAATSGHS